MEIYLDNAATSHPKPDAVIAAVNAALTTDNGNPGRSGHRRALRAAQVLMDCRAALSGMLEASDPMRVVFAFNCTDALNLAIKGILKPGDHAVTTLLEHNSVLRPLMGLRDAGVIDLTIVEPTREGFVPPERIAGALRANTRLAVLTHASNVLGTIQPVAETGSLLHDRGVFLLVDGAQALGEIPVSVRAINSALYAFPGHKGLLGPQGTGGLYIRGDVPLSPLREGGTGSSSESMRQPFEQPERYESGTQNLHGLAGLLAGVKYVRAEELRLRAHSRALTSQLLEELAQIKGVTVYGSPDPRRRVGVVSFNVNDLSSGAVADALNQRGFQVRGGLHCAPGAHLFLGTIRRGAVRASVGHANTRFEIDLFVKAVWEIARDGV